MHCTIMEISLQFVKLFFLLIAAICAVLGDVRPTAVDTDRIRKGQSWEFDISEAFSIS